MKKGLLRLFMSHNRNLLETTKDKLKLFNKLKPKSRSTKKESHKTILPSAITDSSPTILTKLDISYQFTLVK